MWEEFWRVVYIFKPFDSVPHAYLIYKLFGMQLMVYSYEFLNKFVLEAIILSPVLFSAQPTWYNIIANIF